MLEGSGKIIKVNFLKTKSRKLVGSIEIERKEKDITASRLIGIIHDKSGFNPSNQGENTTCRIFLGNESVIKISNGKSTFTDKSNGANSNINTETHSIRIDSIQRIEYDSPNIKKPNRLSRCIIDPIRLAFHKS